MLMWKRLRLPWFVFFSALSGLCCCIFTLSLLTKNYMSPTALPATDIYWFYFGRSPENWGSKFDLIHFFFQLLPLTGITYFVTLYTSTYLLELRRNSLLRYRNLTRWLFHGIAEALLSAELAIALFHGVLLMSAFFAERINGVASESMFSYAAHYQIVLLLAKQAVVIASVVVLQVMLSLRHNLQTGTIVALVLYSIIILMDSFGFSSVQLMLSVTSGTDFVCCFLFLCGCVLVLVISCHRRKETYYE